MTAPGAHVRPGRPGPRRAALVLVVALMATLIWGSARLFVWPAVNREAPADAVVVLGGFGHRTPIGVALAERTHTRVLVLSTSGGHDARCIRHSPPGVEVLCFRPGPYSTQGEAREIGRLAAERHWSTVIVVAGRSQVTRARLRISRCYSGRILMVGATPAWYAWPYDVVYEGAALAKALVLQRTC